MKIICVSCCNHVGVNTISLSVSSFDEDENNAIIGAKSPIRLAWLCSEIKKYDFTLRLSLNLNASVNGYTPEGVFDAVRRLGCDQLTLRKLYAGEEDCERIVGSQETPIRRRALTKLKRISRPAAVRLRRFLLAQSNIPYMVYQP